VWQFPADAHQVRYHEPTRTVLLAKNGVVVTVLSFETATEPQKRAVRQALGGSPGRREQA
jgi:hypothetical protein